MIFRLVYRRNSAGSKKRLSKVDSEEALVCAENKKIRLPSYQEWITEKKQKMIMLSFPFPLFILIKAMERTLT